MLGRSRTTAVDASGNEWEIYVGRMALPPWRDIDYLPIEPPAYGIGGLLSTC